MDRRDPAAALANIDQAEFWSELAPTWLELEDQLEEVGRPPGKLAMDHLGLLPGRRVVDLGYGPGRMTLELAARVGPGGEVVGVDISAEMLARGRERAAQLGAGNVEFVHGDAARSVGLRSWRKWSARPGGSLASISTRRRCSGHDR